MAISYSDFLRYKQMVREMDDLQQSLNDAVLEGDMNRVAFIEQKVVFNAQFLGVALDYLLMQVHITRSKD